MNIQLQLKENISSSQDLDPSFLFKKAEQKRQQPNKQQNKKEQIVTEEKCKHSDCNYDSTCKKKLMDDYDQALEQSDLLHPILMDTNILYIQLLKQYSTAKNSVGFQKKLETARQNLRQIRLIYQANCQRLKDIRISIQIMQEQMRIRQQKSKTTELISYYEKKLQEEREKHYQQLKLAQIPQLEKFQTRSCK